MGLWTAVGVGTGLLALGLGVRVFSSGALARFARKSGIDGRLGVPTYVGAVVMVVAPLALGAESQPGGGFQPGEYWLFAALLSAVGVYLLGVAASAYEDANLAREATPIEEFAGSVDGELVACEGVPSFDGLAPESPVAGRPAVYVDWLVQTRERRFVRPTWRSKDSGIESTPFTLSGDRSVRVEPGARARPTDSVEASFPSGRAVPDALQPLFDANAMLEDLPRGDAPVRLLESIVPADEPVTVVGHASEEDGSIHVRATEDSDPLLLGGDRESARRSLRRRVVWVGVAGFVAVPLGQALAVATSAAAL